MVRESSNFDATSEDDELEDTRKMHDLQAFVRKMILSKNESD